MCAAIPAKSTVNGKKVCILVYTETTISFKLCVTGKDFQRSMILSHLVSLLNANLASARKAVS